MQQPPFDQPQWGQPPQQQPFPQQQPMQPQQPPRKSRRGLWIILAVVGVLLFGCIGAVALASKSATTTNTGSVSTSSSGSTSAPTSAPAATQKPTSAPKWTVTQTFTGNGSKKTATFAVPGDWKILWKCDPKSFQGLEYNVIIEVDNTDASVLPDLAVNTTCKTGNTSGESEEHQAGSVFLSITSEGDWTIQIQELK